MQFSLWTSPDRSWEEVLDTARFAEQSGLYGFWFPDHFMPNDPSGAVDGGPVMECWTVLTAVAALVPRIRLTAMVSPVTFHHPVVLTKRVTTMDMISGGRAVLGIGAGWQINEHGAYGVELMKPGERVSHFEEAIEVINRLLRQDRTDFAGRWYNLADAPMEPKGVQQPIPILVGTSSPRMMRITAKWADDWNTWGAPALIRQRIEEFKKECDTVGRDFDSVRRSAQAMIHLTNSDEEREKVRATAMAGRSIVGNTNELVDIIGEYVELGVDELALPDFTLGDTPEERREGLARLVEEVVPAFA